MNLAIRISAISALLIALPLLPAHAGSIKKWVDEDGVTHYGTTVPPQYVDKQHSELNSHGIEVRHYDRAKTEQEIERDKALEALRIEQQKLLAEQQERDRILLNLYRNEDDLIMARDGKLSQLDGQIRLNHSEIRRLKARLSEMQSIAATAERAGRQLTRKQKENLDSTQRSIERAYAVILNKEDEKRATVERYDYDLARFRKLRHNTAQSLASGRLAESEFPDLVDTAVRCSNANECEQLWTVAQDYARKHATTPVDLAADRILVTAPPRDLHDISITVSRLNDSAEGGERIFLDVQCANFTEGKEFCRSAEVDAIRDNFRPTLNKRELANSQP